MCHLDRLLRIVVIFLLVCSIVPFVGSPANANEPSRTGDFPAIISLSGFNPLPSFFGSQFFPVTTENNVANALDKEWPRWRMCGSFRLCEIIDISWGGDFRNTSAVNEYIRLVRETIIAIRRRDPSRTIIVVAHSWGSVVAYQALSGISRSQMLNNNVALFLSMGSPLGSQCASLISSGLRRIYPSLPGRELIGARLRKPPIVEEWRNMWNVKDPISGPIEDAGVFENYRSDYPRSTGDETRLIAKCELQPEFMRAHGIYYTDIWAALVRGWVERAITTGGARNCINRYNSSNPGSVPLGWGAAFNPFAADRALLFEAGVCRRDGLVEILAGHNYANQYTRRDGYYWNGESWVRFDFSGATSQGNWFRGPVKAHIPAWGFPNSKNNGPNHFVVLTCFFLNNEWRCGFRDTSRSADPLWQLQSFTFR